MNLVIIGGRLQGVEASYLAAMAGYHSTVVDQDPAAPAASLCSRFINGDARSRDLLRKVCGGADLVLPAVENLETLDALEAVCCELGVPLVYDRESYAISSSKRASDRLFADMGLPAPSPWPNCDFPVICKPSGASGSQGVHLLRSPQELQSRFGDSAPEDWVIQECLEGPSYSIEVIGNGREYAAVQTTQLFMDRIHDCKRVLAPANLPAAQEARLRDSALSIAHKLRIQGVFDVEAILCNGECKLLEIDARLPSQTPTAVYHSTGINMLERLYRAAKGDPLGPIPITEQQACLYEHILVKDGAVSVCGEHIMGQYGPLKCMDRFWGADMALTSYSLGKADWAATLIYWGGSRKDVLARHRQTIRELRKRRVFALGSIG